MHVSRKIKCRICDWKGMRYYGSTGILVNPCPKCGRRVNYAVHYKGDQPVTPDPKIKLTHKLDPLTVSDSPDHLLKT